MTDLLTGLRDRLQEITQVLPVPGALPVDPPGETSPLARSVGDLLGALVALLRAERRRDHAWLVLTGVMGRFPAPDDVEDLIRAVLLATHDAEVETYLLDLARLRWAEHGPPDRPVRLVTGAVLVDVDFSARNNKHTGIQRVTREVSRRWVSDHAIRLAVWTDAGVALRDLTPVEVRRATAWAGPITADDIEEAAHTPLLIPWDSTIVLLEVPKGSTAEPMAALARHSGNDVVCVGYDTIPVTSADLRPAPDPVEFLRYLTLLKYSRRVAAISATAATEFAGFAAALEAQGLPGPEVTTVLLAAEVTGGSDAIPSDPADRPLLLSAGSLEPHKNHLAVLHAAELCWRTGLDFELVLVGHTGWDPREIDATIERLQSAGRPVRKAGVLSDEDLATLYRRAHCTVFPSLHEGFGLPVAEGLAVGTPSITTNYGSQAEIAARGGCLLVDPRDDHALVAALTTMLTDRETYARLKAEAAASPVTTWDQYAAELWSVLVAGTVAR